MISVVIPVYNGAEYLREVLDAVLKQQLDEPFEVLVIDSGSTDESLEIVRDFPVVRLIEIPNEQFGHGRTRNLGVSETSGDLIAFLTQDATPASSLWLAAYRRAFELTDNVGAAFGPHLPRPGVNPIMARLLIDHFASFSPDGEPAVQHSGDTPYLSNSNSCIARAAWERTPFRDIAYSEDQAFGADVLENGFSKVYMPDAAALHSHDYRMVETFKRYFDEYRGLHDSVGEKTEASAGKALNIVGSSVAADLKFLEQLGQSPLRRAAWGVRSAVYHAGRVGFGGLGARADSMPAVVRAALSFEGRGDGIARPVEPTLFPFEDVGIVERDGAAPLAPALKNSGEPLHFAWVIPPFSVGGGGHTTIFRMVQALERQGHRCTLWVHDPHGHEWQREGTLRERINKHFMPLDAQVHIGFDRWTGADVAVATGWDTVYRLLLLPDVAARAYFVQDHEPEFFPSSSERLFAEHSYRQGLHHICASPWLAQIVRERYGGKATPFLLGVDADEYAPMTIPRRGDTVVFYARYFTPRRAVELGILALAEVHRRRPNTRIVLYGAPMPPGTPFPYEHLGIVPPARLRELYAEATVGLSLSLTNYSLIPAEMMGCGLPVVELRGRACEGVFGDDGSVITLADDDSADIADKICALLEDEERRDRLSAAGLEYCTRHPWSDAAETVTAALVETYADARATSREWRAGALV